MRTITATEAVRSFSEILNSVKYQRSTFVILRGGKPIASIVPVGSSSGAALTRDLRTILRQLPALGEDVERFAIDLEEIIHSQPPMPERQVWD